MHRNYRFSTRSPFVWPKQLALVQCAHPHASTKGGGVKGFWESYLSWPSKELLPAIGACQQ